MWRDQKKNSHVNCLITCLQTLNINKKRQSRSASTNEMLSLYCTALGFISENKAYNPE